jgi:hypothetical protein
MMAFCRSAANGGQVVLPLDDALNEIDLLKEKLPARKVILSNPFNAKEYH